MVWFGLCRDPSRILLDHHYPFLEEVFQDSTSVLLWYEHHTAKAKIVLGISWSSALNP